jgi:N6-L-threonylcarbamoyladenine synthase
MFRMRILAIETSCDETAISVLEADGTLANASFKVLGNALYSQAALHAEYGGVYPNLAKREHQKNLAPLTTEALTQAGLVAPNATSERVDTDTEARDAEFVAAIQQFLSSHQKPAIDLIAVTSGPGLEPALWTGISFAEALGSAWSIPTVGIDHMEGHIVSSLLTNKNELLTLTGPEFPVLALLISGGHTEFVLMKQWFDYQLVGRTRDDAVGEAFDKVARLLGLSYPGGPEIAAYAARGRARNATSPLSLPRPMIHDSSSDFSFSGLKTAVLYMVRDIGTLSEEQKEDIAREFEDSAREVIVSKTTRALETTNARALVVGGGVSANTHIREGLEALCTESFPDVSLHYPDRSLTGDNAVMIGAAAYLRHIAGTTSTGPLSASGSQSLS